MAEQPRPHAANEHADIHHETSDANIVGVLGFGLGLVVSALLIYVVVLVLFQFFQGREARRVPAEYPLAVSQGERLPPEPRLQTNPREDLRVLRAKEDELLGSYGWVDKNAGVVRIPIEDAMKLMVERGLPARTEQRR
jgi:hypothetical protein